MTENATPPEPRTWPWPFQVIPPEQQTAEHDEGFDFFFVGFGERTQGAVTLYPTLN